MPPVSAAPSDRHVSLGALVARWIEANFRHTKGKFAGQPFALEPWQLDFLTELFLYDTATGLRVYQNAFFLVPRKNGKTALCAALAIFFLTEDTDLFGNKESSPEIYAAANSRDQAKLVFKQAVSLLRTSGLDYLKIQQHDVYNPRNEGTMRSVSSDAANVHGLSPTLVVVDELHGASDDNLLAALRTASGARRQPLQLVISTAGFNRNSPLHSVIEQVAGHPGYETDGSLATVKDRENGFLYWRWAAPDDADIEDPQVWADCNPASWVDIDYLTKQFRDPSVSIENFSRYHLNRFANAKDSFLPAGKWQTLSVPGIRIEPNASVYVGVDVATRKDRSAVVMVSPVEGTSPFKYRVEAFIYEYAEQGTPMSVLVENKLRDIAKDYDVKEIVYDPWNFNRSAEELSLEGLPMVEMPQRNERMCPATQQLHDVINAGRIEHNGDRTLSAHIGNAVVVETARGLRIDKAKTKEHVDAAVALVMAVSRAEDNAVRDTRPPEFLFL